AIGLNFSKHPRLPLSVQRENSVKQLCELYNVVVGLALATAILKVINESADYLPISRAHVWTFLVFIITVVPFYHGAVRHLYATYVEHGRSKRIKNGGLLIDYALLFAEGGVFVGLAYLIQSPGAFLGLFLLLMFLDSVWGVLAYTTLVGSQAQNAEKTWAFINVIFFVVLLVGYFSFNVPAEGFIWQPRMSYMLLGTAFLRTVLDYWFSWKFY